MFRTVTAIERDGLDVRVLVLNFEVPDEKFDLMAAVKAAALEYCQTEDGKKTFDYNCGYFNWADFEMHVPNEICEKHGFSVLGSPVADLVVDWDEQLVDETEVCLEDATYVSVWDGGFKVETACKVNRDTGEVFDIEVSDVDADGLYTLEAEYVRFSDGTEIAVADGALVQPDTLLDIESVRAYMDNVRLDDYDLGGCEITEDDLYTIQERVNDSGSKLEDVVHQYLLEIREVLDAGLDDGVFEADDGFPLRSYDDAVNHLCAVLNKEDTESRKEERGTRKEELGEVSLRDDLNSGCGRGDSLRDGNGLLKIAEFVPIFKSENYFGIYCWHNEENKYFLVDRNSGEHQMVLGDSFEFVGKNTLDCLKDERVLHVANKEWMRYLIDFSLDNVKGVIPESELKGIAVLDDALREAWRKEGAYSNGPSLMEKLEAAQRSADASHRDAGARDLGPGAREGVDK